MRQWISDPEVEYLASVVYSRRQAELSFIRSSLLLCRPTGPSESREPYRKRVKDAYDEFQNHARTLKSYIGTQGGGRDNGPQEAACQADVQKHIAETIECFESTLKDLSLRTNDSQLESEDRSTDAAAPPPSAVDSFDAMDISLNAGIGTLKRRGSTEDTEGEAVTKRLRTLDGLPQDLRR